MKKRNPKHVERDVALAKDLLRRLRNERRRWVEHEAREVALEFEVDGPGLMRRLVTHCKRQRKLLEHARTYLETIIACDDDPRIVRSGGHDTLLKEVNTLLQSLGSK